ncbi:flavin-containing monooxygenase [Terribacillus saccharophilus]|uniref:flavin-containing monooxygenase n=1 Tax=Terribacillus saccharophilus TaxID=361277 RepID=UPI00382973A3
MIYDVIVIGAGQAGLSMSYYLEKEKLNYLVLDKRKEVGQTWQERYDSLVLFTPRLYNALPGKPWNESPHSYPTKNEVVTYLKDYAQAYVSGIQLETEVKSLKKVDDLFSIQTNHGQYISRNVVVATGPFSTPNIPIVASNLDSTILQMHSTQYKNTAQLQEGDVLVVGGGNSGVQIAVDIAKERKVHLAISSSSLTYLPLSIAGKSIFWWFKKLGILNVSRESLIAKKIQKRGDPIFGFESKDLIKQGHITLHPRVSTTGGIAIEFENQTSIQPSNVIWATGFRHDYNWINLQGIKDQTGYPKHTRGITSCKGLYFLGLPWQHTRGSALLQGVGNDAHFIYRAIMKNSTR